MIRCFISYDDHLIDGEENDVFFNARTHISFGDKVKAGDTFWAIKWYRKDYLVEFFKTERDFIGNNPIFFFAYKPGSKDANDGKSYEPEKKDKHPLEFVFTDVLAQVTDGKGAERHGETDGGRGLTFSEQPIMTITRYVGNGYPLGQAMKKLSEVPALMKHKGRDAAYKEILGAIAYAAAAALYLKED